MDEFNAENLRKLFWEIAPENLGPIDESDPTPYEHVIRTESDGVMCAMGLRNGVYELFEMVEKKKPGTA